MVHMLESPALAITRIRRFCVICLYASPSPQFAALFIRPALGAVVRTMMVILLNELRAVPFSFTLCTSTRCSHVSMIWKRTKSLSLSFKKGVWSDEGRLPSDDPLHWGKLLSVFIGFGWYSMDFQQNWSRETWELTWSDEGPTRQGCP